MWSGAPVMRYRALGQVHTFGKHSSSGRWGKSTRAVCRKQYKGQGRRRTSRFVRRGETSQSRCVFSVKYYMSSHFCARGTRAALFADR